MMWDMIIYWHDTVQYDIVWYINIRQRHNIKWDVLTYWWILFCTIWCVRVKLSNCDDTVGKILLCTIRFDKEMEFSNCVDTILEGEDRLVDDNDNWCWREERVW